MKYSRRLVWVMIMSGVGMMSWSGAHAETAREAANKQLVIDYFAALDRLETVDARDYKEQARQAVTKYLRPDYIQHNEAFARFGQGSAGLIRMLESRLDSTRLDASKPTAKPAPQGASRVLIVAAEGDLVTRINSREQPNRSKQPLIIFNLFRIQDGLIAEHWDGASGGPMPGQ